MKISILKKFLKLNAALTDHNEVRSKSFLI